jgi:Pectate lyase superfamily protein
MGRAGFIGTVLAVAIGLPSTALAVYEVPSDRRIPWTAGLDPEGGIPTYQVKRNAVSDHGADSSGASDATSAIQACINAVAKPGACSLPAGTYQVNGTINMPAQVVLRGAGPGATTLNMGSGGSISFRGGSKSDMSGAIGITSGYTKDSTTLTLSSVSGLAVNDWISIFQNNDTSLIDASKCDWCGEDTDNAAHIMMQFAKITAINGNVITINRPMYFTYSSSLSPGVKRVRFNVFMSGLEDMTLNRTQSPNTSFVRSTFSRHCWLRNVETNRGGNNSGEQHVRLEFSHGWEVRDSYLHHGYGHGSGSNYGIHIIFWNSDHKIENNILYSLRHGVNFEGGGNGSVILYNYFDAHYESEDQAFLDADLNPSHGSHPMMVLLEGNSSAKITWDETLGSSSHQTAFRNHARGARATPAISWGRWGIDVQSRNRFMNIVGNVVGLPTWTSGTALANGSCSPNEPVAFRFGCDGQPGGYTDSQSRSTAILHGNFDYITDGVAAWDGGADHTLRSSMYYTSKPWFFGNCAWPAFGPDMNPLIGTLPAKARYEGSTACGQVGPPPPSPPAAPTNLQVTP